MKKSVNLKLVAPTMEYAKQIMEYREEFLGEGRKSIDGGCGLEAFDNVENYIARVKLFSNKDTVPKDFVSSSTFLAINDNNKLVGIINIRHELNEGLLKVGGNIGYGVRKSERKKGYATEMLKLGIEECKALNIKKALVTCNVENIGSAKTIMNNGGVLENEIENGTEVFKRFWIKVK